MSYDDKAASKVNHLMDLNKCKEAFDKMSYDDKAASKVSIKSTKSTIIITESADVNAAADFIAQCFQSEDLNQIRNIYVQASLEDRFLKMLQPMLKPMNTQSLSETELKNLKIQVENYASKGFDLIQSSGQAGVMSTIVKCPRAMITSDGLPIITLEVFRTTKECISFAKSALSIGLWCENISISFEYINSLCNAKQIWLNSSHGAIHPKIPFFNGEIVCEDPETRSKVSSDVAGFAIQVTSNIQFSSTFRANTFHTVVIPFGETFAN